MTDPLTKDLYLGFVRIHILHHASKHPLYGLWMIEELGEHGYRISPGTLYPIFHGLEKGGLLRASDRVVGGKVRKYYRITPRGALALRAAKARLRELVREVLGRKR